MNKNAISRQVNPTYGTAVSVEYGDGRHQRSPMTEAEKLAASACGKKAVDDEVRHLKNKLRVYQDDIVDAAYRVADKLTSSHDEAEPDAEEEDSLYVLVQDEAFKMIVVKLDMGDF